MTNSEKIKSVSAERLRQLIKHCARSRSNRLDAYQRLCAMLPQPVPKPQFYLWVHPRAKDRQQPRHGFGILLERVWNRIMEDVLEDEEIKNR